MVVVESWEVVETLRGWRGEFQRGRLRMSMWIGMYEWEWRVKVCREEKKSNTYCQTNLSTYERTFPLSPPTPEPRKDPRSNSVTTTPNSTKCAVNNRVNNSTVAKLIQKTISPHPNTTCLAVQPSKDSQTPRRSRSNWGSLRNRGSQSSSSPSGAGASGARPCWLERAPRA